MRSKKKKNFFETIFWVKNRRSASGGYLPGVFPPRLNFDSAKLKEIKNPKDWCVKIKNFRLKIPDFFDVTFFVRGRQISKVLFFASKLKFSKFEIFKRFLNKKMSHLTLWTYFFTAKTKKVKFSTHTRKWSNFKRGYFAPKLTFSKFEISKEFLNQKMSLLTLWTYYLTSKTEKVKILPTRETCAWTEKSYFLCFCSKKIGLKGQMAHF